MALPPFAACVMTALVVLASQATAEDHPTTRDVRAWPFAQDSIWNMPIGSQATYVHARIPSSPKKSVHADNDVIVLTPDAPLMDVFQTNYTWGEEVRNNPDLRFVKASDTPLFQLPIPRDWVYVRTALAPNNASAVLLPDGRTLRQSQPFQVSPEGYGTTRWVRTPDVDITGDGIIGSHGGSGMSSLGGTLRVGEIRPGSIIRHALKINLDAANTMYYDSLTKGYRWPAVRADGGASTRYKGSVPALRMGALLALKPEVNIDAWGLRTEPARILARAFQDYGAYVVDDTAQEVYAFCVENGPAGLFLEDFERRWGFPFSDSDITTDWAKDMAQIFTNLHVVDNNAKTSIGGGGTPRRPLAPPFAGSSNTAPTISAIAAQTTAEDTAKSVSCAIGDVETAAASLTLAKASANTTLLPLSGIVLGGSGAERTVTLTPAANKSGTATVTLTVTDAGGLSASRSFVLTVTAVNDPPTLSAVADQQVLVGESTGALAVTVGDVETAAAALTLSAVSSNPSLVLAAGLVLGGSGANRSITVTPAAGTAGNATITLTVSDGTATAQRSFIVTVPALPPGFSSQDIGYVGVSGSALGDGSSFTVTGSGADIWNQADAFQYAWQAVTGDFDYVAKVESQTSTNAWAKAGLMLRESSAVGSRHASVFVTPGNGTTLQYRSSTGGSSGSVAGPTVKAPTWLKLSRRGTTISGYQSADGVTWKLIATRTVAIPASAQLGLAVTSHKRGTLSTAVFSQCLVTPMASN